jgi:hypothetical protein
VRSGIGETDAELGARRLRHGAAALQAGAAVEGEGYIVDGLALEVDAVAGDNAPGDHRVSAEVRDPGADVVGDLDILDRDLPLKPGDSVSESKRVSYS